MAAMMRGAGDGVEGPGAISADLYVCASCSAIVSEAFRLPLCDATCASVLAAARRLYLADPMEDGAGRQQGRHSFVWLRDNRGRPVDHKRFSWILMPVTPEHICYVCKALRAHPGRRVIVCTKTGMFGVLRDYGAETA